MARRLSRWRVAFAATVAVGLAGAGLMTVQERRSAAQAPDVVPAWFAPYVDVTATPSYAFERQEQVRDVVLSFVVADSARPCVPSWGTHYTMDEAGESLELDRRVARLRQLGGDVSVSFGGQINDELAVACTDDGALRKAYSRVIDRYDLTRIDLDIEGEALRDGAATDRRARAIAALQAEREAAGEPLEVWLTLPVAPTGLTDEGLRTVTGTLAGGVDLTGVNVMTMDYAESLPAGTSVVDGSKQALEATHQQLSRAYANAGVSLTSEEVWHRVGMTPMIGQNDVPAEVLTVRGAEQLAAFAVDKGVGRASMWSANRDRECGGNWGDLTVVSDSCSGVEQEPGQFQAAFDVVGAEREPEDGASARPSASASPSPSATRAAGDDAPGPRATPVDDPATSPYPIWDENAGYVAGTKVVWRRYVYTARWWTQGDVPDDPTVSVSDSPWQILGPVLPGETPEPEPTLPEGTYPAWDGQKPYEGGARVLLDGIPYQAKWWTQGDDPRASLAGDNTSPWRPLTSLEVEKAAEEAGTAPAEEGAGESAEESGEGPEAPAEG
ncbi:glycosyl hydrolase family 18 [Xylanimonas oleitrophica]|uniref:Glycosyl hydrolase family 18 n=1 Tax=Xylanimonas oleitrophica TaxID=2607479 RepID=A0A2W5WRL4_9MICO|nr:carbohydrate-binding protein [Xylanimonas oleitrophica]PZR54159.1 glycosyl hydrolase family 18 [Xylanimonas oleitrophica]